MRLITSCLVVAAMFAVGTTTSTAEAEIRGRTRTITDVRARTMAFEQPWHGPYYHREWGAPVAALVPPTASTQTQWSWGVAQTRVTPIWHQFGRSYPGFAPAGYGGPLYPTPAWPSHTDQFGVYPVRGPW